MRRALLIFLGLALITCLEFRYFPGHSYLEGDSQIFVPMLERLDAPGFLSRDPVAVSPHLTIPFMTKQRFFCTGSPGRVLKRSCWRNCS